MISDYFWIDLLITVYWKGVRETSDCARKNLFLAIYCAKMAEFHVAWFRHALLADILLLWLNLESLGFKILKLTSTGAFTLL